MSSSTSFFETLNRLNFPGIAKYKSCDFEVLLKDEALKPFLDSLSSLNEENVLSDEELNEYASIPADELAHLENLAENEDVYLDDVSEDEEREEVHFLQKHLSFIEEHNEILQQQKDTLKFHQIRLLEEKDHAKKELVDAKSMFDTYNVQKVPRAEAELISAFISTFTIIDKLQVSITESDYDDQEIPLSISKDMESYFEEERKLSNYVHDFILKEFEIKDDPKQFTLKLPGYSESEMQRKVYFLCKVLKDSRIAAIDVLSAREKIKKVVTFYQKYEEKLFPHVFKISSSQLWSKIAEENAKCEKLIEKEKMLKVCLSNAISKHVDAQCYKIGTACSKEVLQTYSDNTKKIQKDLERIIQQRARLELVIFYLYSYRRELENIKRLIEKASCFVEKEKNSFQETIDQYQKELQKKVPPKSEYLTEGSVFLSAFELLCDIEQQDLTFITMNDLLIKAQQLSEEKENLEHEKDKKLNILNSLEEQRSVIEKVIFKGKKFADLLQKDKDFNVHLNKLDVKLLELENAFMESEDALKQKKQLLSRNWNLRLARILFILAVMDQDKFHQWIEEIKKCYANLTDIGINTTLT